MGLKKIINSNIDEIHKYYCLSMGVPTVPI